MMMAITPQGAPKWLRVQDVRVDLKRMFLKLGEVAVRGGIAFSTGTRAGGAGGIITAAFGAAEAVSYDTPPETLAWRLLRHSITRAIAELVAETLANQSPAPGDEQYLSRRLELAIDTAVTNEALRVDLDFFENPAALPLLPAIERILTDWLHRFCLFSEPDADSVAKRLPSYFAVALHDEWRSAEDTYKPLLQSLTGPFAKAVLWEKEWARYRLFLIKQFASPVFEERFPLSAIYVPLRAAHLATLQEAARPGSRALDRRGRFMSGEERGGHTQPLHKGVE